MKNIYRIFLFSFLLLSHDEVAAQNFGAGFYAGLSTSQIHGDGLGGYDLPGANLGFFTRKEFGEKSAIQLELAFLQKGAREPDSDTSLFYKVRLNYIEVPLIYQYRWNHLSFEIGPALDILVTSTEEQMGFERQSNPPYSPFNLTLIAGISWHFSERLYINFRTNNSLTSIRKGNAVGNTPQSFGFGGYGQRNIVLSFALVYNL